MGEKFSSSVQLENFASLRFMSQRNIMNAALIKGQRLGKEVVDPSPYHLTMPAKNSMENLKIKANRIFVICS